MSIYSVFSKRLNKLKLKFIPVHSTLWHAYQRIVRGWKLCAKISVKCYWNYTECADFM